MRDLLLGGGSPAGEQAQRFLRAGARLGRVGDDRQAGVGGGLYPVVAELELADDRVVEALLALGVKAHVVGRPEAAELLTSGRELADEIGERSVERATAGLEPKERGDILGRALPVGEELLGARVEKHEAREVDGTAGAVEEVCMESTSELIGGEGIEASVLRDRGRAGHRVEQPLHARTDVRLGRAATPPSARLARAGEVGEVDTLCLVELQRPRKRFEHGLGDTGEVAALEPRVVVDAHAGEERDLFPPEPGNAAVLPVPGKAGLVRGDPRAPGSQELADLAAGVHGTRVRPSGWRWEALPVPGSTGSVTRRSRVFPWVPKGGIHASNCYVRGWGRPDRERPGPEDRGADRRDHPRRPRQHLRQRPPRCSRSRTSW